MNIKGEIDRICLSCAKKKNGTIPDDHVYSAWQDICDVCKEFKEVTDPMDFKYMKEDF